MTGLHPRNYGEPTDRGFEIAMDAHTDRVGWARQLSSARLELIRDRFAAQARKDGFAPGEFVDALEVILRELPKCEPIYLDAEPLAVVEIARETLPAVELRRSDIFLKRGFVWFARPSEQVLGTTPQHLVAMGWVVEEDRVFIYAYPADSDLPTTAALPLPGPGREQEYDHRVGRLLVTFWLLAGQRLFVSEPRKVSRAVRRRSPGEIETVVVVRLRKTTYPETNGTRKVDWSHRWLVGGSEGFWRNQWFPKEKRHRPRWIAPYVKGPADKPFVAKRRSFEFDR